MSHSIISIIISCATCTLSTYVHIIAASTQVSTKYLDSNGLDGDNNDDNPSSPCSQSGPQLDEELGHCIAAARVSDVA
jgi:hypothetical protein